MNHQHHHQGLNLSDNKNNHIIKNNNKTIMNIRITNKVIYKKITKQYHTSNPKQIN